MTNSKQLIVLAGSGRKGIVKLTLTAGGAKGSCALDFRPAGATLYLVGDEIAQIALKDINTQFEVPFLTNNAPSCLVRSSSLTMFGGAMPHSELIKRVDEHLKSARRDSFKRQETASSPTQKNAEFEMNASLPRSARDDVMDMQKCDHASSQNGAMGEYDDAPSLSPAEDRSSFDEGKYATNKTQNNCAVDKTPQRGDIDIGENGDSGRSHADVIKDVDNDDDRIADNDGDDIFDGGEMHNNDILQTEHKNTPDMRPQKNQNSADMSHTEHQINSAMPPSASQNKADISHAGAQNHDDTSPAEAQGVHKVTLKESLKDWTHFDGNNFYYAVRPQLDEMFVCYPADDILNVAVQNSKWVRVDAADGSYSVGILYDGEEPAFICYAVPEANPNRRPPAEIEGMCVWLPVSSTRISGYWVIYQSAKTGEIIK